MSLYARKDRERHITEAISNLMDKTLAGQASPFCPTDAPPGSPNKIAMLSMRFDLGLDLFHPGDQQGTGDPTPAEGAAWLLGQTESLTESGESSGDYDLDDVAA